MALGRVWGDKFTSKQLNFKDQIYISPVVYFKIVFDSFHMGRVIFLSHFAIGKG